MVAAASRSTPASSTISSTDRARSSSTTPRSTTDRMRATSSLSSIVRAGASPRQNGIVGCLSPASTTRTSPPVTCRICQWCVPRMNTSPAIDSVAQSSLTLPISVSSGSAMTRKSPSSGMAPPLVRAASRAPLRPRSSPLTRSWWT